MADIELTYSDVRANLNFYGKVGQTVDITFAVAAATGYYAGNAVLPPGLVFTAPNKLTGTLQKAGTYTCPDTGYYSGWIAYSNAPLFLYGANYYSIIGEITVDEDAAATAGTGGDISTLLATIAELVALNGGNPTLTPSNPVAVDEDGYLTAENAEGEWATELDFDLISDQVLIPDVPTLPAAGEQSHAALPDWAPGTFSVGSIISVSKDDRFALAIGLNRRGVLQTYDDITEIEILGKEFATEETYDLTEAGFVQCLNVDRYKVMLNLADARLGQLLDSYESPDGAYVDLMCKIRVTRSIATEGSGAADVQKRSSHFFALRFEQPAD